MAQSDIIRHTSAVIDNIGTWLSAHRGKAKQVEVAKAIGIDAHRLGRYERSTMAPPMEVAVRLSQLYKVSLDRLITGHESAYCSSDGQGTTQLAALTREVADLRRELETTRNYSKVMEALLKENGLLAA